VAVALNKYERNANLSLSVQRKENTQTLSHRNMTIRAMSSVLKARSFHAKCIPCGSDKNSSYFFKNLKPLCLQLDNIFVFAEK
jgi:hypothetical protein